MRVPVTSSSGHLGEALVRTLRGSGHQVVGLDVTASPFTSQVGSKEGRKDECELLDRLSNHVGAKGARADGARRPMADGDADV